MSFCTRVIIWRWLVKYTAMKILVLRQRDLVIQRLMQRRVYLVITVDVIVASVICDMTTRFRVVLARARTC